MRILIFLLLGWLPAVTSAQVIYVDSKLFWNCDNYNVEKRACLGGKEQAFTSLFDATVHAKPGTEFRLREGRYEVPLHLTVSGTKEAPIVWRAHADEEVLFEGVTAYDGDEEFGPIWLDGVSYNHIIGFKLKETVGFVRAVDAHHNVIKGNTFETAAVYPGASKRGGLYFAWSDHNRIEGNTILRGTDSLALVRSSYNVVENNHFDTAGHELWVIKCGSFNVVRGNRFENPEQKIGAVFDCEEATTAWAGNGKFAEKRAILDDTKRNLIENNTFARTTDYYSTSGGNGIQYAGQNGIIRRNIFFQNNVGLAMTHYEPEALYTYGNRVYHNTFHDNFCGGLGVYGADPHGKVADNQYVNNVLWDNKGWGHTGNCADVQPGQVVFRNYLTGHHFRSNLIGSPMGKKVFTFEFGNDWSLREVAAEYDLVDTLQEDPRFADSAGRDYAPSAGSPTIDAGAALTQISGSAGSGRSFKVLDASYFFDGFGIAGEQGDLLNVGGTTARIVGIDYNQNVITVDRDLSWAAGAPVTLDFAGNAPDLGAIEHTP